MRILFFANDVGGGNLIVPIAERARQRGNALFFIASGPSLSLWREEGFRPVTVTSTMSMVALRSVIARFRPDIVVTGTSIRTKVEHTIWAVAQKLDIRTFAMIDGWAKISDRFPQKLSTRAMPYRVGVVDQRTANVLTRKCGVPPTAIHLIGHPHLQRTTQEVTFTRARRNLAQPPTIGFFSAPLLDNEATVGLVAIEKVVADLDGHIPITLLVKPHPRELMWPWRNWISAMEKRSGGIRLRLVENMSAAEILGSVDAVIGLSASVLIEAAFAGIPVLALQFGEPQRHENSAIETYLKGRIARSTKELRSKISELFVHIGQSSRIVDTPVTLSADRKAIKAIELAAAGR